MQQLTKPVGHDTTFLPLNDRFIFNMSNIGALNNTDKCTGVCTLRLLSHHCSGRVITDPPHHSVSHMSEEPQQA